MSLEKCGAWHRKQSQANKVCVFCGKDIKYNLAYHKHYTPPSKTTPKFKPTELTYKMVADALYSQEYISEATASPSNNPSEFTYKWFVTNSGSTS